MCARGASRRRGFWLEHQAPVHLVLERGDLGLERVELMLELPGLGPERAVLGAQPGDGLLQLGDPVPAHDLLVRVTEPEAVELERAAENGMLAAAIARSRTPSTGCCGRDGSARSTGEVPSRHEHLP